MRGYGESSSTQYSHPVAGHHDAVEWVPAPWGKTLPLEKIHGPILQAATDADCNEMQNRPALSMVDAQQRITLPPLAKTLGGGWSGE